MCPVISSGPIKTRWVRSCCSDPKDLSGRLKVSVADTLVEHLAAAGVTRGSRYLAGSDPNVGRRFQDLPIGDLGFELGSCWPPSVSMLVFPRLSRVFTERPVPPNWIRLAVDWLEGARAFR